MEINTQKAKKKRFHHIYLGMIKKTTRFQWKTEFRVVLGGLGGLGGWDLGISYSSSDNQASASASLGMAQSPLGERPTEPTLGPSVLQLRLNCWVKKR
jgi:hypothetical protein